MDFFINNLAVLLFIAYISGVIGLFTLLLGSTVKAPQKRTNKPKPMASYTNGFLR